jgi:hypothetical protein
LVITQLSGKLATLNFHAAIGTKQERQYSMRGPDRRPLKPLSPASKELLEIDLEEYYSG